MTDTIGEPSVPEIEVSGNGVIINNGDVTPSAADGSQLAPVHTNGGSTEQIFTITNTGDMPLMLNATISERVQLLDNSHGAFSVAAQPTIDTIAPDGSTNFSLSFDPAEVGSFTATVSIENNDADENPFSFVISGEGTGEIALQLTKTADRSAAGLGDAIEYTVVASNNGTLDATGAAVSDILPAGLTFVANSTALEPPEAGTPGDAPTLANDLTIRAGRRVTVTYKATVTGAGTHTNEARVFTDEVTPVTAFVDIVVPGEETVEDYKVFAPLIIRQ